MIHAFFMLAVEFRCPAPIHFRSKLPRYHHRPDGCFQKRSPYTSQQHATKTRCFYQLQLLKLHHVFHDLGGFGWCVRPTSHKSGNIDRISKWYSCHAVPASMNIVFHSGNGFLSVNLRLNQGIIGCSPNSVPMLWVWRFLWGILILSWNNNPRGLPNYPLTQLSLDSNWAVRLFYARTPATPVGGHTISRRRQRCLPANHRTARRCGYVTWLDSGVEEK